MTWTEFPPLPPCKGVKYSTRIYCETPLGCFIINRVDSEENYFIYFENRPFGKKNNLDHAKQLAKDYLIKRHEELTNFITNNE